MHFLKFSGHQLWDGQWIGILQHVLPSSACLFYSLHTYYSIAKCALAGLAGLHATSEQSTAEPRLHVPGLRDVQHLTTNLYGPGETLRDNALTFWIIQCPAFANALLRPCAHTTVQICRETTAFSASDKLLLLDFHGKTVPK